MDSLQNWVLVVGDDPISREQLRICRDIKPNLAGVEKCWKTNANKSVCGTIDFFPAFCNMETKECAFGIRKSLATIEAVASLAPPKAVPQVAEIVTQDDT